jgi:Putative Ig domain
VINGNAVTTIYAQHTSFAKRQFSSAGCVATLYHVLDDDPDLDCTEGAGNTGCNQGMTVGGQLFISCAAGVCPTITISPPTLPAGTQGTPYSQQLVGSGGQAPYTFAVTSGTLPAGLTLTSGGLLSGTPTAQGTSPFTVTATDANNCTGSINYSLVIGAPTQVTIQLNPAARTVFVGGTTQFTAIINVAQATDTVVTLQSADTTITTVPPTVTILAGHTTATFNATGVAVGGPITITASLPPSFGATPATATVTVIAAPVAAIPTLSGLGLALLAAAIALMGALLLRLR